MSSNNNHRKSTLRVTCSVSIVIKPMVGHVIVNAKGIDCLPQLSMFTQLESKRILPMHSVLNDDCISILVFDLVQ